MDSGVPVQLHCEGMMCSPAFCLGGASKAALLRFAVSVSHLQKETMVSASHLGNHSARSRGSSMWHKCEQLQQHGSIPDHTAKDGISCAEPQHATNNICSAPRQINISR